MPVHYERKAQGLAVPLLESEAGRELAVCLREPLGGTADMTDRQRRVPCNAHCSVGARGGGAE